jgi:hypothetical protein
MIDTHNMIIEFGKHKGERWTRVPVSYLKWLINEGTQYAEIARAEIARRGTKIDWSVEVSPHAIDRASIRCRRIWHETALNPEEGLFSWLNRVANEAVEKYGKVDDIYHLGMKLSFKHGTEFAVLMTVVPKKAKREDCIHPAEAQVTDVRRYTRQERGKEIIVNEAVTFCKTCGKELLSLPRIAGCDIIPGQLHLEDQL